MNRLVITDSTLCIGCHTCEAACSETHRQHGLQSIPRLRVMLNEKEPASQLCHHHEDTPCATIRSVSAITRVDGATQLSESLYVNCKLCGIAYPFSVIELSGSRPLDIPANVNTPGAPPVPPAPARVSTSFDWVPDIRTITIKCNLCSSNEQGPVCVRMYPTKAPCLMDNTDITRVSKRKCELTFSTSLGDPTLFQQAQSEKAK